MTIPNLYWPIYKNLEKECLAVANYMVSAIPQISAKTMSALRISLPPIGLQREFSSFVVQSDKSKFELEQTLVELTGTYKKLMSENFK